MRLNCVQKACFTRKSPSLIQCYILHRFLKLYCKILVVRAEFVGVILIFMTPNFFKSSKVPMLLTLLLNLRNPYLVNNPIKKSSWRWIICISVITCTDSTSSALHCTPNACCTICIAIQ